MELLPKWSTAQSSKGKLVSALDAAFPANLVKRVNQASPVVQENRVIQVIQDSLALLLRKCVLFQLNHRATPAHRAQLDRQANPGNLVTQDHQAHLETQVKTVNQVSQALKDHQAAMENQAKMAHRVTPDQTQLPPHRFPETKDQMEIQEAPDHQAHLVQEAKTVNRAVQAPKVHLAQPDQPAKMAKQDPKDPKVPKAHQAKKVSVQNIALWTVVSFSKMELVVKLSTKLTKFITFKNSILSFLMFQIRNSHNAHHLMYLSTVVFCFSNQDEIKM